MLLIIIALLGFRITCLHCNTTSLIFTIEIPMVLKTSHIFLTRRTFVGKVMSLLLNMLSRLVITFLPRSKNLLISWLQSPSAVILEPQKIKSDTVSTVSPSISHEVVEPDATIFVFWILSFKPTLLLSSFTFRSLAYSKAVCVKYILYSFHFCFLHSDPWSFFFCCSLNGFCCCLFLCFLKFTCHLYA